MLDADYSTLDPRKFFFFFFIFLLSAPRVGISLSLFCSRLGSPLQYFYHGEREGFISFRSKGRTEPTEPSFFFALGRKIEMKVPHTTVLHYFFFPLRLLVGEWGSDYVLSWPGYVRRSPLSLFLSLCV